MPSQPSSSWWTVTAGDDCELSSDGACVTDGEGNYGNYEACTVRAEAALTLQVVSFDVEAQIACGFDSLTVGGTKYCGSTGPDGVVMAAGDTMQWRSDGSVTRDGFVICARGVPPPSPPSAPILCAAIARG